MPGRERTCQGHTALNCRVLDWGAGPLGCGLNFACLCPFGLLGLLVPELLVPRELCVSALRTSGFMGVTTSKLGLRDVIYVGCLLGYLKGQGK